MFYNPLSNTLSDAPSNEPICVPLVELPRSGPNTSFVPGTQFQFVWDSVSLGLLRSCLRKYHFRMIDQWDWRERPVALAFGAALHTVLETYHKCTALMLSHDTTLLRCVRLAALLGEHLPAGDNSRTKETLIRAVVWYLDQYENDPFKTALLPDGRPAVELSFMLPVFDVPFQGTTQTIYLSGHIDRVVQFGSETFVCDYKSSKYSLDRDWIKNFQPSNQFLLYYTAAQILASQPNTVFPDPPSGVVVDAIQLGVNFNRYSRFPLRYTPSDADQFLQDFKALVQIKALGAANAATWPAESDNECHAYRGCEFLCACTRSPHEWDYQLRQNFDKGCWDPRKPR